MVDETESDGTGEPPDELRTSGHIERTVLHSMVGDSYEPYTPTTVSGVLDDIVAVIRRGGYANVGPSGAVDGTVRKSAIRRSFTQLREKGLVQRVSELDAAAVRSERYDLGAPDGDADDPSNYAKTSDDARVTDWVLTDEGRREVERLDAAYAAELDELAARYGRPPGETTTRLDGNGNGDGDGDGDGN